MTEVKFGPKSFLTEAESETLWSAILEKVEELKAAHRPRRGDTRSQAFWGGDGHSCACRLTVSLLDGTTDVYFIEGRHLGAGSRRRVHISVDRSAHSSEPFWEEQIADRANAVVVDGTHYRIRPSNDGDSSLRGFAGRRFALEDLATGERIKTNNLWYQGVIPPTFRDRLPDTHRFLEPAAASRPGATADAFETGAEIAAYERRLDV